MGWIDCQVLMLRGPNRPFVNYDLEDMYSLQFAQHFKPNPLQYWGHVELFAYTIRGSADSATNRMKRMQQREKCCLQIQSQ